MDKYSETDPPKGKGEEYDMICRLSSEEIKVFRKNPHCISSICEISRLHGQREDLQGFQYKKNFQECLIKSNIPQLDLPSIVREGTFVFLDQLLEPAVQDMGGIENVRFLERGQRPTTTVHLGQLKLFLSTLQFLTHYSGEGITHVVYPGSAPGNNIDMLSKLFPKCYWYLYDPRDVFNPALYQNEKVKKIVVNYFLPEHIKELQEEIGQERMLFISDIRVCDDVSDQTIERDMRLQEEWVRTLRPSFAQLKFRLPRELNKGDIDPASRGYQYLTGDIYLQMFGPQVTTETRLVVSREDLGEDSLYYLDVYEGQLDEAQFGKWVKQASRLPGERM